MTKILIIDDDAELREIVSNRLHLENYQVMEAENGEIGVKVALGKNPDIILMDIIMPVMNGHKATEALVRKGFGGMILALTTDSDFAKAKEAGAYDFLAKPLTPYFEKRIAELWTKFTDEKSKE